MPINSGNLDWSDAHKLVRNLSNEQTASIFIQQNIDKEVAHQEQVNRER